MPGLLYIFPPALRLSVILALATMCLQRVAHGEDAAPFAPPAPGISDLTSAPPPAIELSPLAEAAGEAGIVALGKNKFEDAETDFLKLLKLSPDNISALVNLGLVEYRLGHADQSQKYLQRAVRLKPDAALAWMVIGIIDTDRNDLVGATAALAESVYLNPKNPQAHNYFAAALSKRGWYSAAEDELQQAIELSPNFAEAHFNLALTYLLRTPPAIELARRHYQKALDLGAKSDPAVEAKLNAAPEQTVIP